MKTIKIAGLEHHDAAKLFPLVQDNERKKLADDIKARGVLEPIHLYDGKVLDGRNRVRAAQQAGLTDVPYIDLPKDTKPYLHVVSMNVLRRHLTARERIKRAKAALAAEGKLADLAAKAEARKKAGKGADGSGGRGRKTSRDKPRRVSETPTKAIAAAAGVPVSAVKDNAKVDSDPEVMAKVDAGEMSVTEGARVVRAKKPKPTVKSKKAPEAVTAKDFDPESVEFTPSQNTPTTELWARLESYASNAITVLNALRLRDIDVDVMLASAHQLEDALHAVVGTD